MMTRTLSLTEALDGCTPMSSLKDFDIFDYFIETEVIG